MHGTRRWRWAAALFGVLLLLMGGCLAWRGDSQRNSRDAPREPAPELTSDACELLTPRDLDRILRGEWSVDDGLSNAQVCALAEVDGPGRLTINVNTTPNRSAFRLLHPDPSAQPVPVIGSEAWWWERVEDPGGVLVFRVEGRAVSLDLAGQSLDRIDERLPPAAAEGVEPEPLPPLTAVEVRNLIFDRLYRIGALAAKRLKPAPFENVGDSESGQGLTSAEDTMASMICSSVTLDGLAAELEEGSDHASLSNLGDTGCVFATDTGVNVVIEVLSQTADDSALAVGRTSTVEGETLVWEPEVVEGVGDRAVWLADPTSGTTGDLHALFGTTHIRVISSGPTEEGVKDRAVRTVRFIGPDLAALSSD